MQTLTFSTVITAPAKKVWDVITTKESYEAWTNSTHPGSTFIGSFEVDAHIRFVDASGSGTLVHITELIPHQLVKCVHLATLTNTGEADTESHLAKSWIGTTEDYRLSETNSVTTIVIEMKTSTAWVAMFEESWPKLLTELKAMCEAHV